MDLRERKAWELAAKAPIRFAAGAWLVPSQTSAGTTECVTIGPQPSCQCEDWQRRRADCKHILAAKLVAARVGDAVPKKPTYKQNWPLDDQAQRTEKQRLQVLVHDLCRGLEAPPQPQTGRRWKPRADIVFAGAFKVFCTLSRRRFQCDLDDALGRGYLSESMHAVRICAYLDSAFLTPVLPRLIVRSSLPLKAIETTFAPDSTGFSTSRFIRWFDENYGVERSGHAYVKAQAMTGVKPTIVTAVEIHGPNAGDAPQFRPLAETTAPNFKVKEVLADKAYLRQENLELVETLGGTAYIPFKSNSVAGEAGALWERMCHYYNFRREEFLKHYHQRRNAESTFSMVKAKFRDHVRSKTATAMKNDVLCKFLCHNIVVVHQSQIELGIEPVFGKDEPAERPDVLPLLLPG